MSQQQVTYAALKVGAVVVALVLLYRLPNIMVFFTGEAAPAVWVAGLVTLAFYLAAFTVAAAMWFLPVTVARRLGIWEVDAGAPAAAAGGDAGPLAVALLTAIGVYFAVLGLSDLGYNLGLHWGMLRSFGAGAPLPDGVVGGYLAAGLELGLGLWLALRARQAWALVNK